MRYELFRDTLALYKCDECCSYEHFHKSIELIYLPLIHISEPTRP